jgi:MFS family permease
MTNDDVSEAGPVAGSRRGVFAKVPKKVKWLIYLISFSSCGYGYLLIFISAYLLELDVGPEHVGIILGVTGATFVASAIPLGIFSDRRGRKPVLFFGLIALPPSIVVFGFTTNLWLLVIAGIVAGVAEGAYLTTWNAIIADQTTTENRDAAFSLSFTIGNIGMGAGMAVPLLFPLLQGLTGLDSYTIHVGTLVFLSALALISPIGLWPLLKDYKDIKRPGKLSFDMKKQRPLLKFSGINSLIGLGAGFIIPLIATWMLLKFAVPDTYSGPLLAVASLTIALTAIASSALSRRYGRVRAIVMTQGLSMVFMLSLAFMPTAALAGAVYLVRAGLMNMSVPISDSFLMGIVSSEDRGLASAINSLFWRLPNSATTVAGGYILKSGAYDLPIFIAASFYAVSITLFYLVFKDVKPSG